MKKKQNKVCENIVKSKFVNVTKKKSLWKLKKVSFSGFAWILQFSNNLTNFLFLSAALALLSSSQTIKKWSQFFEFLNLTEFNEICSKINFTKTHWKCNELNAISSKNGTPFFPSVVCATSDLQQLGTLGKVESVF